MTWRLYAYQMIRPEALSRSLDRREARNKKPGGLRYRIREVFGEPPSYYNNDALYRTSLKMVQVLNQEEYIDILSPLHIPHIAKKILKDT